MIRLFCDRCRRMIEEETLVTVIFQVGSNREDEYDLCTECAEQLKTLIEVPRKGDITYAKV